MGPRDESRGKSEEWSAWTALNKLQWGRVTNHAERRDKARALGPCYGFNGAA